MNLKGMSDMKNSYPFVQDYDIGRPFDLRRSNVFPCKVVEAREVEFAPADLPAGGPFVLRGERGEASIVLDFGEERVGWVHLRMGCSAECRMLIYYGEVLPEALRSTSYQAGWYTLPADEFQLVRGLHERVSQGRRAFRFMRLCLSGGQADVEVKELKVETVEYPVEPLGKFQCSNERLNEVWKMACRTTRLCMQQFYEDGIKRDGLLWIGDYRVEFLCNVGAFGDSALARRSLLMMAASQRSDGALPACAGRGGGHQHPYAIDYMPGIPTDSVDSWIVINYCADYLCAVDEYLWHTGDQALLIELQPCLKRLLRFLAEDFDARKSDLMETPYYSTEKPTFFADNCCGFSSRATLYAQLIRGFDCGLSIASRVGDRATADLCRNARATLVEAFKAQCLDPETHSLHDETNSKERPHAASWCAPAFVTLAGLLNKDDARRALLDAWTDPEAIVPVNGYAEFFFLQALFAQDLADEALAEMERYWGGMLDHGLTTCAEGFNRKQENYFVSTLNHGAPGSFCHGWSAGPAYLLPSMVLGVAPLEPGYRRVCVQPALGGLRWAEGDVPTPQGIIRVRWEQTSRFVGRVLLPPGVSGVARSGTSNHSSGDIALHEGWNDIDLGPAVSG